MAPICASRQKELDDLWVLRRRFMNDQEAPDRKMLCEFFRAWDVHVDKNNFKPFQKPAMVPLLQKVLRDAYKTDAVSTDPEQLVAQILLRESALLMEGACSRPGSRPASAPASPRTSSELAALKASLASLRRDYDAAVAEIAALKNATAGAVVTAASRAEVKYLDLVRELGEYNGKLERTDLTAADRAATEAKVAELNAKLTKAYNTYYNEAYDVPDAVVDADWDALPAGERGYLEIVQELAKYRNELARPDISAKYKASLEAKIAALNAEVAKAYDTQYAAAYNVSASQLRDQQDIGALQAAGQAEAEPLYQEYVRKDRRAKELTKALDALRKSKASADAIARYEKMELDALTEMADAKAKYEKKAAAVLSYDAAKMQVAQARDAKAAVAAQAAVQPVREELARKQARLKEVQKALTALRADPKTSADTLARYQKLEEDAIIAVAEAKKKYDEKAAAVPDLSKADLGVQQKAFQMKGADPFAAFAANYVPPAKAAVTAQDTNAMAQAAEKPATAQPAPAVVPPAKVDAKQVAAEVKPVVQDAQAAETIADAVDKAEQQVAPIVQQKVATIVADPSKTTAEKVADIDTTVKAGATAVVDSGAVTAAVTQAVSNATAGQPAPVQQAALAQVAKTVMDKVEIALDKDAMQTAQGVKAGTVQPQAQPVEVLNAQLNRPTYGAATAVQGKTQPMQKAVKRVVGLPQAQMPTEGVWPVADAAALAAVANTGAQAPGAMIQAAQALKAASPVAAAVAAAAPAEVVVATAEAAVATLPNATADPAQAAANVQAIDQVKAEVEAQKSIAEAKLDAAVASDTAVTNPAVVDKQLDAIVAANDAIQVLEEEKVVQKAEGAADGPPAPEVAAAAAGPQFSPLYDTKRFDQPGAKYAYNLSATSEALQSPGAFAKAYGDGTNRNLYLFLKDSTNWTGKQADVDTRVARLFLALSRHKEPRVAQAAQKLINGRCLTSDKLLWKTISEMLNSQPLDPSGFEAYVDKKFAACYPDGTNELKKNDANFFERYGYTEP